MSIKAWVKNIFLERWRVNRRASNQLMMIWLKRALTRNKHLESAVDVGCGKSINRPYFRNKKYTGVDQKEEFIAQARLRYSNDEFYVADVSRECPPAGDLVVCTLVLNNKRYPREKTLDGVKNLIKAVCKNGTLIFTTGHTNSIYEDEIKNTLMKII